MIETWKKPSKTNNDDDFFKVKITNKTALTFFCTKKGNKKMFPIYYICVR